MSDKSFQLNPLPVCTELYGAENVNDVRDCLMDSIYRYYGPLSDFHKAGVSDMIQQYMIDILNQAGKNPRAVKLALPPSHLQPAFFVKRYFETFDREKAYQLALHDCRGNKDHMRQCYVDMRAMADCSQTQSKLNYNTHIFSNKGNISPYK